MLLLWIILLSLLFMALVKGLDPSRDSGASYDLSKGMFSPSGRLMQMEYAQKVVHQGPLCVGIRCCDGVVLAAYKPEFSFAISAKSTTNKNIYKIDDHIHLLVAGSLGASLALVQRANDEAADHWRMTGERIPGRLLADKLASRLHEASLHWDRRAYPNAILIASSTQHEGVELFLVETTGTSYRYSACAVGLHSDEFKKRLEQLSFPLNSCDEAIQKIKEIVQDIINNENKDKEESQPVLEFSKVVL